MIERPLLALLNHLLDGAPWARTRLMPYAGRRASFDIPPLALSFAITAEGRLSAADGSTPTDVVIRLPADTPLKLPQGLDKAMAQLSVEGNAEFATALSFVFRNLRWDIEEDLSWLVGDIAAHRLVLAAARFSEWQRRTAVRLAENLAEYLAHERRLLVPRDDLDVLRAEIDRLTAALGSFESRLASFGR
ncbi:ubiquinone biosynthesis accessory factor UbiJ [Sulfuricystis multivorans]|uniref:ubiquinone biosynthesis accessory factor UbiJ n=1 Tax=Sulfuricystis multivorans TaxID=2211108 RepID=UPI000F81CF43|nr:SCP2 sterol-binding domain-containing protein [Sulfuricystis multivorans]